MRARNLGGGFVRCCPCCVPGSRTLRTYEPDFWELARPGGRPRPSPVAIAGDAGPGDLQLAGSGGRGSPPGEYVHAFVRPYGREDERAYVRTNLVQWRGQPGNPKHQGTRQGHVGSRPLCERPAPLHSDGQRDAYAVFRGRGRGDVIRLAAAFPCPVLEIARPHIHRPLAERIEPHDEDHDAEGRQLFTHTDRAVDHGDQAG